MTIAPYYQRGGVVLYCGRAEDIAPQLHRRGLVLSDPPYSPVVHERAVSAGRRTEPLLTGAGAFSPSALARKVDLGFRSLTPELRRFLSQQAARLASRWALFFCDGEGLGKWADDLTAAGIPYRTHCLWLKVGGTPKFTGQESAIPDETIAMAGEDPEEAITGGHIACAHRDPGDDDAPRRWWNAGGKLGFYPVNTCLDRGNLGPTERRINTTQKPEKLIHDLILDWSDPGEHVIDLCAGGCTTLVVAARLGHPVTGIELREEQCEAAAKRLDALFARPEAMARAAKERVDLWVAARRYRAAGAAERKAIRDSMKRQGSLFAEEAQAA
jgi:site-specific DNA-methyltransferase (adenine-specific)